MPLLMFYIASVLAVTLKILVMIMLYSDSNMSIICAVTQPVAKTCAGLIQAWMMFELAMRFRQSTNVKCLNFTKYVMTLFIITFYFSFTISYIVVLVKNSDGEPFIDQEKIKHTILTINVYTYLILFIVILIVNIDLIMQIRKVQL